jgi:bisphosphoglycerate-dependent phosphoglycerate mutase
MPKSLPKRENPKFDYLFDPPLTEMGLHQAKLTGEELLSQGITITHCYSSPALRSIQTADKILEGMNLKKTVPIRIELGLFEFLRWQINMPNKYPFMDLQSLVAAGYNIDLSYTPALHYEMLQFDETEEIYYQRSYYMTKKITDMHDTNGILLSTR